jgi:AbrB family looped-hinge helix DNA binding protein
MQSRAMHVIANAKGQIVIPAAIRRKLGIKAGTRIHIEVDEVNNRIVLTPITSQYVHSLRGSLRGRGVLKLLMEEKRREREL